MKSGRYPLFGLLLGVLSTGTLARGQAELSAEIAPNPEVSQNLLPNATLQPTFAYTQEDLLADLAQQLTERYRVNGELQVSLLRAWSLPRVSEALSLIVLDAPPILASTVLVHFRLQAGTRFVAETSLLLRVQLMREVWCVRAPAERGTAFDPAQFDTRRVDTLRERDTISTTEPMGDLTLTRSLPAGRVLSWHDVARRAFVRKGQIIDVRATTGSLTVNMKGLAMENGTVGDTIRVRNIESKKEFPATVVAESRAEVRL